MQWLAFSAMCVFYSLNIDVLCAVSLSASGFRAGFAVFSETRAARRMKKPRGGGKKPGKALIMATVKSAKIEYLRADGTLGLGDAAATSLAWGLICALANAVPVKRRKFRLNAGFAGIDLSARVSCIISLRTGKIIYECLKEKMKERLK